MTRPRHNNRISKDPDIFQIWKMPQRGSKLFPNDAISIPSTQHSPAPSSTEDVFQAIYDYADGKINADEFGKLLR